ncbi:O-antigen ligase family protein [Shinella sp. H4-D48]|uniref:O-antigen ligase family protein n=1 Tax=Shinella sp. H4-D48 TaxID=2925841 RepID=UPI001F532BAD|nr:O-antigen ligase family protein [Shinella sp. H4-D48]UNK38242.1 O-antigen ligase family protein [Shinella sp. H4-D48]
MKKAPSSQNWTGKSSIFSSLAWLAMASAMIVESDSYRYATLFFVALAGTAFRERAKSISAHWLVILCYIWAAYVFVRFIYGILGHDERGTSEWLYVFPIFFPLVGIALHATRNVIYAAATALIVAGLFSLIVTLDFETLLSGARAAPLWHNNPIHAGVGSGMIFLCSVFWALYSVEVQKLRGRSMWLTIGLGVATAVLGLLGVLGSQSKGVWLALAATTVFSGLLCLLFYSGRWRVFSLATATVTAGFATIFAYPYVQKVAGPTIDAIAELFRVAISERSASIALQRLIDDPATPSSMGERLKLISNAIEVYQSSPWIGSGNVWLTKWKHTTYGDVPHTIIHNGYLEIIVRHGLLGMTMLAVFVFAGIKIVNDAHKKGHLSTSLTGFIYCMNFFFFCTVATNSNNRLALGESFFIFMGGVVFALLIRPQTVRTQPLPDDDRR